MVYFGFNTFSGIQMIANYLTYENEIVLIRDLLPARPTITRDADYR